MSQIFLDIETVPCDDPEVINEIAATITPPGNYKKPETIAAWEQGEKKRAVEEAVARTSFDGGYGRIICIGYAFDDDEVDIATDFSCGDEQGLLAYLFALLNGYANLTFVGHNISWDLRMLYQRAVVHGIAPPRVLLKAMRARPWDGEVIDTMRLWDSDPSKKISLDKLCKVLGIKSPKGEMDGSKVAQAYKEGRISEIAEYCKRDLEATRECFKRLTFSEEVAYAG